MKPLEISFRRLNPQAILPKKSTAGSSGFDLYACLEEPMDLAPQSVNLIPTGWSLEIPEGYEGQVRARSGLAMRHGLFVINGPGTIDSDYRGPLGILLANFGSEPYRVESGARIAQIVFCQVPQVVVKESDSLSLSERGEGGFGHTGI